LREHKRIHSNARPYDCPHCGKLFKRNDDLKVHIRTHTGVKLYSCRHCSDRFARPDQLKRHLLESHDEGTALTCHICEKIFKKSIDLEQHISRHMKRRRQ